MPPGDALFCCRDLNELRLFCKNKLNYGNLAGDVFFHAFLSFFKLFVEMLALSCAT